MVSKVMLEKTFTLNSDVVKLPAIGQGGIDVRDNAYTDREQIEALRCGLEYGMALIDTAESYSRGHSEELVGKAVRGRRSDVIIATKFAPENNSYNNVLNAVEGSLRRLNTDYIDIYQIHWPNPSVPLEETLQAMEVLVAQGKVRYIGVSNFYRMDLLEVVLFLKEAPLFSNQSEFNLFDRFAETLVLPFCQKNNIAFFAYSPLCKGKIAPAYERIREIAKCYDKTAAQLVLNWIISHPNVIAIPKAVKIDHLRQNATSVEFQISDEHYTEIDAMFPYNPKYINTNHIHINNGYQTVEDAVANSLNCVPSPVELAKDLKIKYYVKPIHVIKSEDDDYILVEGHIRYWAWVIAHGALNIPAFILT
jgi:diketogulonate reductase-like aldo/keto reductase